MAELRSILKVANLPSEHAQRTAMDLLDDGAVGHATLRVVLAATLAADAERLAAVVVADKLKGLSLIDFGGLVACGTNRAKAEALILDLLFPEAK